MDIREQLKNPVATGVAGLIVGAIFGLVILGWWLFPVKYAGAGPKDLRPEAKADYMRMAIESYGLTRDAAQAKARYDALGADAGQVLQEVANRPGRAQHPIDPGLCQCSSGRWSGASRGDRCPRGNPGCHPSGWTHRPAVRLT